MTYNNEGRSSKERHFTFKVNKRIDLIITETIYINKDFIKILLRIYQMVTTLNRLSLNSNNWLKIEFQIILRERSSKVFFGKFSNQTTLKCYKNPTEMATLVIFWQ